MADTEKITINLSVVDLGHIDLLVEQGVYSSRTDLIRTAIRNQIDSHSRMLNETIERKALVIGILSYDAGDLEEMRYKNQELTLRTVGMLILEDDITPELARAVIKSVQLFGVFKASDAVKEALADRMS